MKIYFTASLTGKYKHIKNYKKIVSLLKKQGHTVVAKHIFDSTADGVRKETWEERLTYLKYLNKWLTKCDLLVAETTHPCTSVGFEIATALNRDKPVLVLYANDIGYPPVMAGLDGNKLFIEQYSLDDLNAVLVEALKDISLKKDQRFTILFPPDIIDHLSRISSGGIDRSKYIRNLIKRDMKKK